MFPHLRARTPRSAPVIDRLERGARGDRRPARARRRARWSRWSATSPAGWRRCRTSSTSSPGRCSPISATRRTSWSAARPLRLLLALRSRIARCCSARHGGRERQPAPVRAAPAPPQLVPSEPPARPPGRPATRRGPATSRRSTRSCPGCSRAATRRICTPCAPPATRRDAGERTLDYNGNRLVVDQRNRTAVMTRIRWRAMDRIHELSEQHGATERTAADEAGRVAARKPLLDESKPYLDFLKGEIKDPQSRQNRFEHWYDAVQRSVLRVLELLAVADAQGTGLKADGTGKTQGRARKEQTAIKDMGSEPWCGAFAERRDDPGGDHPAGRRRSPARRRARDPHASWTTATRSRRARSRLGGESLKVHDFHAVAQLAAQDAGDRQRRRLRRLRRPTRRASSSPAAPSRSTRRHPAARQPRRQPARPRDDRDLADIGAMTKIAGNETAMPGRRGRHGRHLRHPQPARRDHRRRTAQLRHAGLGATEKKEAGKSWTPEDEKALADVEARDQGVRGVASEAVADRRRVPVLDCGLRGPRLRLDLAVTDFTSASAARLGSPAGHRRRGTCVSRACRSRSWRRWCALRRRPRATMRSARW